MGENRYQRALEKLRILYKEGKLEEETFEDIEELVYKETPNEVVRTTESASYDCDDQPCSFEYELVVCPYCGSELVDESEELDLGNVPFCPNCGQHLDWGEEDEQRK